MSNPLSCLLRLPWLTIFLLAACSGEKVATKPTLPAGLSPCPVILPDHWEHVAAGAPHLMVRDPVFPEVRYGFNQLGWSRSSEALGTCGQAWDASSDPFVMSSSTVVAGARRSNLRFMGPTIYWGDLYVSEDAGTTYVRRPTSMAGGPELRLLDVRVDPGDDDALFALAQDVGVVVSRDDGKSFAVLTPNPTDGAFVRLAVEPSGSGLMIAAVAPDASREPHGAWQVWRSEDRGQSWTTTKTTLEAGPNPFFAVSWTAPPTLYAGGWESGVLRSRDGGATFVRLTDGRLLPGSADPKVLLVRRDPVDTTTGPPSYVVSADDGETFVNLPTPMDTRWTWDGGMRQQSLAIEAILGDPRDPRSFTLLTQLGFFEAHPGDTTATRLPFDVPVSPGSGRLVRADDDFLITGEYTPYVWIDPRNANHLLLASNGSLLESSDGGRRFSLQQPGGSNLELTPGSASLTEDQEHHVFGVDAKDPKVFYAWNRSALLVSDNAGQTYRPVPLDGKIVLQLDQLAPSTLYAAGAEDAVGDCQRFRSLDRGETWSCLTGLPDTYTPSRFATHPQHPSVIYAFGQLSGFFLSTDGGKSWQAGSGALTVKAGTYFLSPLVSPSNPDHLFMVVQEPDDKGGAMEALFASQDQGRTWGQVSSPKVRPTLVDPRSSQILYAPGPQVSTDGGRTFRSLGYEGPDDEAAQIVPAPSDRNVAYVITRGAGLYRLARTGLAAD